MVISDELLAAIEAACTPYPQKRGGLLPALHLVQQEHVWVSRELALELAEIFGIHPVEVMEIVTFYNMFYDEPQGRHHAYVCTSLSCSLRGSRSLLRQLEAHLAIEAGQTTPDGRITLGHEECLGACGVAPMMRIDQTYHEDLDVEKAKQFLDALD